MIARVRAVEPYLWLLAPLAIVAGVWMRLGAVAALLALCVAVAAAAATLLAYRAEARRLRAWYDAELGRADDELDEYDALRALVAPVVGSRARSHELNAAVRHLKAVWPRFAPAVETETQTETEEESTAA